MSTPEDKAAQEAAAKAAKAAQAEANKQKKAAEAAAKKVELEAKKAEADAAKAKAKADREAAAKAKVDAKEAAKAEREAKKQAKLDAAAVKKAEREANRMPEQNGVRRPGPTGLCGKVWALADEMSAQLGQPVAIAPLLDRGAADGLNVANIRTEYARWKKFHGLSGRVSAPATEGQAA